MIGQCQPSWPLIGRQWSVTDVGVTPGTLVGHQSGPGHHHHYIRVTQQADINEVRNTDHHSDKQ